MASVTQGGIIVRHARNARGYTQRELSERTGFAVNTIHNWEAGKARPSFDDVLTIIKYLGFSIDEALELTHDKAA